MAAWTNISSILAKKLLHANDNERFIYRENSCVLKTAKALNGVNSVIKNLDYKLYIR